jgi:hypothetical protein
MPSQRAPRTLGAGNSCRTGFCKKVERDSRSVGYRALGALRRTPDFEVNKRREVTAKRPPRRIEPLSTGVASAEIGFAEISPFPKCNLGKVK